MAIDVRRARRALRTAGTPTGALSGMMWPFGRERRMRALIRRRLAVLEAKNAVVDVLFRVQKPLADYRLYTQAQVEAALNDRAKRPVLIGLSPSREVIEEELRARYQVDAGVALDQALAELAAEGVLLRVPAKLVISKDDVYLAVQKSRPHYEVAELNRLARAGSKYTAELRRRAQVKENTDRGRSYNL